MGWSFIIIHSENENGTYELKSKDGKLLKQKVPGVNLKIYHKRPKMDGSTCGPQGIDTADVISPDPGLPTVMSNDLVQTDKPDDSATTEDDITVTAVDSSEPHFGFVPTSVAWRKYHATRLKLPNPRKMKIRQKQTVLTVPKTVDRIKGDGNCFFRAMSLEITGSQSSHPQVRELTVRFLCDPKHAKAFSNYNGSPIMTYLESNRMADDGTWATDVEILAMATLLQTTIFVYTQLQNHKKWLPYQPLFHISSVQKLEGQSIYLSNLCAHFERIVRWN